MNKQDIFAILDKNAASQRKNMKIVLWVGIVFLIGGFALIPAVNEKDVIPVVSIISGIGAVLVLIAAIALGTNSYEKKTEGIKHIFNNNPSQLVWAYVFKQNNRGAISVHVVMNFKDGKSFMVDQNAIPNQDCNGFMHVLTGLNPNMHLGYSEELEYKFKQRTL